MQRIDDSVLRIVIVDYNSCIFSPKNNELGNKHYLSANLVKFIIAQHYNYFIGHTFRCYINIDFQREQLLKNVHPTEKDKFKENYPTATITKHVAEHTGTTCMVVSTLDDMASRQVGSGAQILENYEIHGVKPTGNYVQMDKLFDFMHKNNEQLLLIAQYIASVCPDKQIQLDIIDDELNHCKAALTVDQQQGWPANVTLNAVYRFSTNIGDDQVRQITEKGIELTTAIEAAAFVSSSASLFAGSASSAASSAASAAARELAPLRRSNRDTRPPDRYTP